MTEKPIALEQFVSGQKFSDPLYAGIFEELMKKFPKESERQHMVRAMITIWKKKYPAEMELLKRKITRLRETRMNDLAMNKESEQQLAFSIPESLWNRLSMVIEDPPFLTQSQKMTQEERDEWTWFIENFPEFCVPKVV